MEKNALNLFCVICQENFSIKPIAYTCGHNFCINCSPFILYNMIDTEEISTEFFNDNENIESLCMICGRGKTNFPFDRIYEFFDKKLQLKQENDILNQELILCNSCEQKNPSKWCENCQMYWCDMCEDMHHSKIKGFSSHKVLLLFEKNKKIKKDSETFLKECKCSAKSVIYYFCVDCNASICRYCYKIDHENHNIIDVMEILSKKNQINYEKVEINLKQILNDCQKIQFHIISFIKKQKEKGIKNFDYLFEEIQKLLGNLRKKIEKPSNEQYIKKKFSLIDNSLFALKLEFEKYQKNININAIHPNKVFQMNKISEKSIKNIKGINNFSPLYEDEDDDEEIISKLKEIVNILLKNDKFYEEASMESNNSNNISLNPNPMELVERKSISLGKNYCVKNLKSNISVSFSMNNNETFLVWPGDLNSTTKSHPIFIYNLSLMKKQKKGFSNEKNSTISVVSTYPKDEDYESPKWLYTADDIGVFRVYDLMSRDQNDKFKQIYKIDEKTKVQIDSAVIFDDKYDEISKKKDVSNQKGVYALICYYDINLGACNKLYKLEIDKEPIFIKKIDYKDLQCNIVNFYYDDILKKTRIFFSFSDFCIRFYDFASNSWLEQGFGASNYITYLNSFSTTKSLEGPNNDNLTKVERYLIFSDKNTISIGNIETRMIVIKKTISDVEFINDLCIWNSNYIIISTYSKNTLQVLNFQDLNTIYSKNINHSVPCNLVKVKIKNEKNETREGLVSCQTYTMKKIENSQINLYV